MFDRQVCLAYYMNMNKVQTSDSAKIRILKTASDLFYRQGYRSTGTNEIIKKAGAAKASFSIIFQPKRPWRLLILKTFMLGKQEIFLALLTKGKRLMTVFLRWSSGLNPGSNQMNYAVAAF